MESCSNLRHYLLQANSEMLQESNISKFKSQVQNSQVSPSSYGQHWVSTWVSTCRKKRLADGGISASGEHANLK
ncbi:unnamed protein product [Urochloa humidicola]